MLIRLSNCIGVFEYKKFQAPCPKAPNYNTQITNKFQIPIFNVQNV
jgi:hypothetical protein